ncbi:hypothetical protein [Pseudoduganella violaceinigra]|uniref:hypothetical protein n=1 Tax=Pseudoduganella violaceinigra TaxID=246602 RepID=UPI00041346C2|nr:hypothetical protein [Pseudoduganella violaceinigra]
MLIKNSKVLAALLASAFLATACGGGGGDPGAAVSTGNGASNVGNGSNTSSTSILVLTPNAVDVTIAEGSDEKARLIVIDAKVSDAIHDAFALKAVEKPGVGAFMTKFTIDLTPVAKQYKLGFTLAPDLKPGEYNTSIDISICYDDGVTCAKPQPGSPWTLPVKVKITPKP